MKDGYRYRNKGQFQVDLVDNEVKIGFYSEKSHKIIDIDSCLIQNEESEIIIRIIKKWMKKHSIMPAKKNGAFFGDGILRNIVIRKAFKTNEIMVILVTLHKEISYIEELIKELNSNVTGIKSIIQNINDKDTNWVMGEECITLAGQNYITDYIGDFKFNISALSFFQVNPYQTEVLYNKALEYADLSGSEVVFDAYCGTGTITLFLSQKAKKVYGVEVIEQAIENAKVNATLNNVANAEFFVGKSEEVIPNLIGKGIRPNVIVVDPPRKGCDIKLLDSIGEAKPDRVVYVSCDPSTLARDLKCLEEKGYRTVKVQPVDMFPMTKHVETVALLSKLGVDKHIDVEIKLDELDLTSAESKATYAQIKEYVLEKFGLKVSTLYIAQIKKKCGIEMREHYNKSKKDNQAIPQCTPEKEEAIMDALRHFKMI